MSKELKLKEVREQLRHLNTLYGMLDSSKTLPTETRTELEKVIEEALGDVYDRLTYAEEELDSMAGKTLNKK